MLLILGVLYKIVDSDKFEQVGCVGVPTTLIIIIIINKLPKYCTQVIHRLVHTELY